MVTKRHIGYFQIGLGIVLFLMVISSAYFLYMSAIMKPGLTASLNIIDSWKETNDGTNSSKAVAMGNMVSDTILHGAILRTATVLYGVLILILFVLSLFFISEGWEKLL